MKGTTYQRYMRWITRQPSIEQGLEQHGVHNMRQLKALSVGNEAARDTLRLEAMRLALRVAKTLRGRYTPDRGEPDMDMVQEATLAAMTAAETWDPDQNSFPAWVMRRAAGAAIDFYYTASNGGLGGKDYKAELEDVESLVLLEYVWDDEEGGRYDERLNALATTDESPEVVEDRDKVRALLDTLPMRLQQIVASYYGIRVPQMTLKQLAAREGVAISTVRLWLLQALGMLRDEAKLHFLPDSAISIVEAEEKAA